MRHHCSAAAQRCGWWALVIKLVTTNLLGSCVEVVCFFVMTSLGARERSRERGLKLKLKLKL